MDPLSPCLHLFNFGNAPSNERSALYINPRLPLMKTVNRELSKYKWC